MKIWKVCARIVDDDIQTELHIIVFLRGKSVQERIVNACLNTVAVKDFTELRGPALRYLLLRKLPK
jgi:hypothetical protein